MKYRFYIQYEGLVVEWDNLEEFDNLRELLRFKKRLYRPVEWGILKEWTDRKGWNDWDYVPLWKA